MRPTPLSITTPEALTATDTGAAVDVSAFHGLVDFTLLSSATGGAGQTSTVTIEHSDTGSAAWSSAGVTFTAVTDAAASVQQRTVNVDSLKKFVRAVTTLAGTDPTVTSAVLMAGNRNYA